MGKGLHMLGIHARTERTGVQNMGRDGQGGRSTEPFCLGVLKSPSDTSWWPCSPALVQLKPMLIH